MSAEGEIVRVPTEDGRVAVIEFERHERFPRAWTLHISDELILEQPQLLHAVLWEAIRELADRTREER